MTPDDQRAAVRRPSMTGRLDAGAMLDSALAANIVQMAKANQLPHIEPDTVSWPFFRVLFGLPPKGKGIDEMYEVEAFQLFLKSEDQNLLNSYREDPTGESYSGAAGKPLRDSLVENPDISRNLRSYLTQLARSQRA